MDLTPEYLHKVESLARSVLNNLKSVIDLLQSQPKDKGIPQNRLDDVIKEVQQVDQRIKEQLLLSTTAKDRSLSWPTSTNASYSIVCHIVGPTLKSLAHCYDILDQAPAPTPSARNKPTAPAGMLSVKQYTDAAVGLEILVHIGIEPFYEFPCPERLIPRTLRGRFTANVQSWCRMEENDAKPEKSLLEPCALLLGELLLLDRFRPMLARHVPDMHAALLQMDHTKSLPTSARSFVFDFGLVDGPKSIVDRMIQARSFQWLLRTGLNAPAWLRQAVGVHLADLSCRDLSAVVSVFVGSFPSGMQEAAATRLAQTLVTPPTGVDLKTYYHDLVNQVWAGLDHMAQTRGANRKMTLVPMLDIHRLFPASNKNLVDTSRLILEQLPEAEFERLVLPGLVRRCQKEGGIHKVVRRLGLILINCERPTERIRKLFLSRIQLFVNDPPATGTNLLGLIVRVASLPKVFSLQSKIDAIATLRSWVHTFSAAGRDDVMLVATSLVHSIAPFSGDMEHSLMVHTRPNQQVLYDPLGWDNNTADVEHVARDTESRATMLVDDILQPICATFQEEDQGQLQEPKPGVALLPSMIFQLVLTIYFSSGMQAEHSLLLSTPVEHICSILFRSEIFHIVALSTLPILCERCPPAALLYALEDGHSGILELMRLCFSMASHRFGVWQQKEMESSMCESLRAHDTTGSCFLTPAKTLRDLLCLAEAPSAWFDDDMTTSDEMLLSITSILMTLLIGILELGSRNRSDADERLIESFAKSLRPLAVIPADREDTTMSRARCQMAEMSSHAMALIASRFHHEGADAANEQDRPTCKLTQAELDLESSEPPIRARGVVSLRHAAAGLDANSRNKRSDIIRIMRLCLKALDDKESYVYLAAVQTLVALVNLQPSAILLWLLCCLGYGVLDIGDDVKIKVNSGQRAKLGEAIIFFLRRRASVYEFLPTIFDMLTWGNKKSASLKNEEMKLIATETNTYFAQGDAHPDQGEDEISHLDWDEVELRLKTGGPLFMDEEEDVVRASILNVVAEALMVSSPASICVPYLPPLVHCTVSSMQLESSRVVRRASALVARELYSAVIREAEDASNVSMECAMVLVAAEEERLFRALQRCINSDDLGDLRDAEGRMFDQATRARCTEALSLRESCDSVLAAARLVVDRVKADSENPVVKLVTVRDQNENPMIQEMSSKQLG